MSAPKPNYAVVLASLQQDWGGGEVYLSTLAQHLRERGVVVEFIVRTDSAVHDYACAEGFSVKTVRGNGRSPFELWSLRRWLQQRTPAILHCNDSHALTCAGLAAVGLCSIKVLAMRHTMFRIRSSAKYRGLADRVVGVSHAVVDACETQGIPRHYLRVIHSGINPPSADNVAIEQLRREFLTKPGQRLIVAVGNLLACKGHSDIVSATGILKRKGLNVRTVIAGEGDERSALERQIADLDLQNDVVLAGFRTDADQLLAAADVVTHPAYDEGLCLTVAAALMLARPVVCTAVGGLKDVIGADSRMKADGPFAETVKPGQPEQLALALEKELERPATFSRRLQAATFAIDRFSATRMVDETVRLYHELWDAPAIAA